MYEAISFCFLALLLFKNALLRRSLTKKPPATRHLDIPSQVSIIVTFDFLSDFTENVTLKLCYIDGS